MSQALAPIVLFTYNRPELTRQTLECLSSNPESKDSVLYIFSDGPKPSATESQRLAVQQTRAVIREKSWCGEQHIVESDSNQGLARSVIAGVTRVLKDHPRVIVLEDDLKLSPYFLQFMNNALELYAQQEDVLSVHGYLYPVDLTGKLQGGDTFFVRDPGSLGWATWRRAWALFDPDSRKLYDLLRLKGLASAFDFGRRYPFMRMLRQQIDGKVDSWAIRWRAVAYLHNKVTLYPSISLVTHEGNVPQATHHYTGEEDYLTTVLSDRPIEVAYRVPAADPDLETCFGLFLRKHGGMTLKAKILKRIRRWLT